MPAVEPAEVSALILDIYDTTVDAGRWPLALDKIARFIGARGAFIFELDSVGVDRRIRAPYYSSAYDKVLVDGYLQQHNRQEVEDQDKFARFSKLTDQIQLIPDDVLADSEAELLARPNTQQMLQYGIRYRAGALLNKDQVNQDRFALQFTRHGGPVSREHLKRAEIVMPHIAKALNISRPMAQLSQRYRSVADCLDLLVVGICILNASGTVVLANREFQRQLESYKLFRKDPAGRLIMTSEGGHTSFNDMRGKLSNHGRFGARPRKEAIVSDVEGKPHTLCIEVAPLNSADEFGEPSLRGHIVYSMDTGNFYQIDGGMLAEMFDLTKAESAILELMAEGLTNAQISERREKSIETVNSQVKSVLEKTNSANRTQVIRLATNISSSFVLERHPPNGG